MQIDGHAPLLSAYDLNAYIAAGMRNCHETTSADEAREKLAKGMQILMREGRSPRTWPRWPSSSPTERAPFLALCTDDRNPLDIAEEGHLDYLIRSAIARGCGRCACLSRGDLVGGAPFRPASIAAWWRPASAPTSCCWKTSRPARCTRVICRGAPVDAGSFKARPGVPLVGLEFGEARSR